MQTLRLLLRKGCSFAWGEAQQSAFDLVGKDICEAGVLAPFDIHLSTFLTVDASACGLGAV